MHTLLTTLAAALLTTGCWQNRADLDPAPLAEQLPGIDAEVALARAHGVTLLAAPDAWRGEPRILDQVTPLWIGVQNDGERPIVVRYAGLRLVARDRIHAALPPIVPDPDRIRLLAEAYEHRERPGAIDLVGDRPFVGSRSFRVEPILQPLWPSLPTLDADEIAIANVGATATDTRSYDSVFRNDYWRQHQHWAATTLPAHPLVTAALPEGVLEPGGYVEGLVYFERVPDDLDSLFSSTPQPHIELVLDLVDASDHTALGRLRIPFIVD